jgi:uncharacterized RDD family membrane protein YckC
LTSTDSETAGVGAVLAPAELDRRFYAYVVDRAIGWGLGAAAGALLWYGLDEHRPLAVAGAVVGAIVLVSLVLAVLQGTSGATPGKSALGIRAVHVDTGRPPGIGRALERSLLLGAAGLPTAGLGVATLAWTAAMDRENRRRAWHDRVTRSLVVDVRPVEVDQDAVVAGPRAMINLTAMRLMPTPDVAPATPLGRHAAEPAAEPAQPQAQPPAQTAAQTAAQPSAPTVAHPVPAPAQPREEPPGRSDLEPTSPSKGTAPEQTVRAPSTRSPGHGPVTPASTARWRVAFDTGESFVVEGLALVGRGPEPRPGEAVRHVVPLRSTDMSLSKTHAQFHVARDGVLVVMDRGSTNGSVLIRRGMSRELAAGKPATLVDGDRVRFGDREMLVARDS